MKAVVDAWEYVRANPGVVGVGVQSVEELEVDLEINLYRLWEQLCLGAFMPPAVRTGQILTGGVERVGVIGVPGVADRVAQMVVVSCLEPGMLPGSSPDSFSYRP